MPNTVLGVSLILISGLVTWSSFVELDSERLIYLEGQKFEPRSLWLQSSVYFYVQIKCKVEDNYPQKILCKNTMQAHVGLITFGLTMKSRDQKGFQLLNPMDILKFLYYWTFLLCSTKLITLSPVILCSSLLWHCTLCFSSFSFSTCLVGVAYSDS